MGNVPEKNVPAVVAGDVSDSKSCGASSGGEGGDLNMQNSEAGRDGTESNGENLPRANPANISCSVDVSCDSRLTPQVEMTDDENKILSSCNRSSEADSQDAAGEADLQGDDPCSETIHKHTANDTPANAQFKYDEGEITMNPPPDLQDIQLDEDLNAESLPFESLNSSFRYSVLLDSDSEEDDEDEEDSSSVTSPYDLDVLGSSKLRLDLPDMGDTLDFMSTEAENQLEGCDKWSLGSCSLGGFECRTSDKRRRSSDSREENEVKLPVCPEKIPERSCDESLDHSSDLPPPKSAEVHLESTNPADATPSHEIACENPQVLPSERGPNVDSATEGSISDCNLKSDSHEVQTTEGSENNNFVLNETLNESYFDAREHLNSPAGEGAARGCVTPADKVTSCQAQSIESTAAAGQADNSIREINARQHDNDEGEHLTVAGDGGCAQSAHSCRADVGRADHKDQLVVEGLARGGNCDVHHEQRGGDGKQDSHASQVVDSKPIGESSQSVATAACDAVDGEHNGEEAFCEEDNLDSSPEGDANVDQGLEPSGTIPVKMPKLDDSIHVDGEVTALVPKPSTEMKDNLDASVPSSCERQESLSTGIGGVPTETGNIPVNEPKQNEAAVHSGTFPSLPGVADSSPRVHCHHAVPPVFFPPSIDEVDETEEDNCGDSAGTVQSGGTGGGLGVEEPPDRDGLKTSPKPGSGRRLNKSAPAKDGAKADSKSYFAKSMLPGLSGLHGLSSLRQSAQNFAKNTQNSKTSSGSTVNLRNACEDQASRCPDHRLSGGSNPDDITWQPKRLSAHRQLSSSDSWGSDDFESYSSNDEDPQVALGKEDELGTLSASADGAATLSGSASSIAVPGRSERLKDRLLRKRENWRERRQSSGRDIAKGPPVTRGDTRDTPGVGDATGSGDGKDGSMEDVSSGVGRGDGGKLSRWFSLRKSNNTEAGDRKISAQGAGTPTPQSAGHPLAGGRGVVLSGDKTPAASKAACEESDPVLSVSSDGGSQHHRNSSTLSTASFSSSSSSSTTSSLSSPLPPAASSNTNCQPNNPRLPQLTELEERMSELDAGTAASNFYLHSCGGLGSLGTNTFQRKHQPPNLPPMPPGLTPEQIKRRHIVASIVHSENNYVATLHRLVRDYRKPLEESKPPMLSQSKVAILFHYVHELLQCHTLFRIALTDCVRHWDRDEKIGDVFFACFSKSVVLEIYSEFINNFTRAMELAKLESRKKSIFADFLKMRQIASPDRLSFFGMMVKPVQRFPQFILFLQDLLKHTPKGHPDRMSLQLALTQLESLAETLNELKRESEQHQAFKATLKQINSKFALRSISEGNRCLIRQDDATKLEFGPNGLIKQTKERRLFLTTDAVICVSVVPKTSDDVNSHERLSLKWVHPITEIEVQENNSSLTLSRLLAAGLAQRTSGSGTSSLGKTTSTGGGGSSVCDIYGSRSTSTLMESEAMVGAICAEMNDLMHDYQVVSRIAGLVSSLKGCYDALNASTTQGVLDVIQQNIQARDDRMSWLDGCCLQIKAGKDVMTFHVQDPGVKKDWIIELRLAQLAVSSVNSPAWDTGDADSQRPPSRRPLFVTALPLLHASHDTQVVCGCQYPLLEVPKNVPLKSVVAGARRRRGKTSTSVWICSTDGVMSYVTRYVTHLGGLRECGRASLHELCVTGMLHVPPSPLTPPASSPLTPTSPAATSHPLLTDRSPPLLLPLSLDTVWIGTLQNRLLVYSGSTHDSQEELSNTELPAAVSALIYHCHMVFVGLTSGMLVVYHRSASDGCWMLSAPDTLELSAGAAVSALLPLSAQLYAAVADSVVVVDCASLTILKRLSAHHGGTVSLLAHSGIGLWLSEEGSSTVCLYHTESCRHLQDIDLAPSISRMLGLSASSCGVVVTALVISRGLLWVGTSLGVTVTLPLPRLQGVPIISGRPTLSCHAHTGPVTFLMTLMPPEYYSLPRRKAGSVPPESMSSEKEVSWESEGPKNLQGDSCAEGVKQVTVKRAHTLPRGFGASPGVGLVEEMGPGAPCDEGAVLGLCGDLLRHWTDENAAVEGDEGQEDDLRRSDPSLSSMGSTLDRRLRLRDGRPRSLDLSSASIDSKISALTTTSSGSDDSSTVPTARQSTIREDCDVEHDSADSGHASVRENTEAPTSIVDGCLDTSDVAGDDQVNKPDESSKLDEGLDKQDTATETAIESGKILEENSVQDIFTESTNDTVSNNKSEENPGTNNNTTDTLPTNALPAGSLVACNSTEALASEAETSERQTLHNNASEGSASETKAIVDGTSSEENSSGDQTEETAVNCNTVNTNTEAEETLPAACGNVTPIIESTERSSSVTKSTKGHPKLTAGMKSDSDATRDAVSLTASVEDVTRPKEARRRTHRRSSSDVTLPVSDAPPVNSRPKISLPAGPVSSVASEIQNPDEIRLSPKPSGKGNDRFNTLYSSASINRGLGTLSRSPTARSMSKNGGGGAETAVNEQEQPRTVLVLTGGRGYKCIRDTAPTNGPPHNNTDAHILVWEMKL